ncbi:Ribonuclease/ribotoxin [Dendrothele bispora CBS 962.96]|uniref:Ribonuclease/ribotoxin n=1 Tax=Dendrothele bispora (strain CBS 962.96) TaxID=1314807 RepID=A0A4S8KSI0_DENBC|nr:Ribonuclease/ribotoxin [Dendrothele bispora CBS 962.96]
MRFITVVVSLVSVAIASPIDQLLSRALPRGDVTCGSDVYSVNQVVAAVNAGVNHLDDPIGSDSYPHTFNNFEGLDLFCSGETRFNEFPILTSGTYNGGSPGADRVVFSNDGTYCAVVTHTGASGNDFVSCRGD